MLLAELYKLSRRGAEKPLIFWLPEYNRIKKNILPKIKALLSQLHDTSSQKKIQMLKDVLSNEDPDEMALADALLNLADIIQKKKIFDEQTDLEQNFIETVKKFYHLAKTNQVFTEKRNKLKKTLSLEEQVTFDNRLFQNEGLSYCLEYYLEIYKRITDTTEEKRKKYFFENEEITIESGNIPGLWADFQRLEVLEKFIYSIFDDQARENLIVAYFEARNKILKIKTAENFIFQECSLKEAIENLKKMIQVFLTVFKNQGIEKLKSHFLTPYGNQPRLSDIKL